MFENRWFLKEQEALQNAQAQNANLTYKDNDWSEMNSGPTLLILKISLSKKKKISFDWIFYSELFWYLIQILFDLQ